MEEKQKSHKIKGRGTSDNPANRFEPIYYDHDNPEDINSSTQFFTDTSKSLITFNKSPDISIDAFINPYRGCEHGCVYCYARPFHEYLGLSAGLDFETKIFVKENAPVLLKKELTGAKWKPQIVGIGGVTDAYQPAERKWQLTRKCLQVFNDFNNPVAIITKNTLVQRDKDILKEMAEKNTVFVLFSITSLNDKIISVMEPRTSRPLLKLKAIEELTKCGIKTGVMIGPVVPGLTDHEIPEIIKQSVNAGAVLARYILIRLPFGVKELFEKWLEMHFSDRKEKVLNRIRSMRDGSLYNPAFFERQRGNGIFAEQTQKVFETACRKNGIEEAQFELTTKYFKNTINSQLSLF